MRAAKSLRINGDHNRGEAFNDVRCLGGQTGSGLACCNTAKGDHRELHHHAQQTMQGTMGSHELKVVRIDFLEHSK